MYKNKVLRNSILLALGMLLILGCEKSIIEDLEATGNNFESGTDYYPITPDSIYFSNVWPPRVIINITVNEEFFSEYQNTDIEKIAIFRNGELRTTNANFSNEVWDLYPPLHTWCEYRFAIMENSIMSKISEPISVYTWD